MYKETLRSMEDIEVFPVVAILIFVVFFVLLFVYVIRIDKKRSAQMAQIPLGESADSSIPSPSGKSNVTS